MLPLLATAAMATQRVASYDSSPSNTNTWYA